MNSYLPGKSDEYPAFASMTLAQEWDTCEEALRELVSTANWEHLVEELTGTVEYVEATDPSEPGAPDTPGVSESLEVPGQVEGRQRQLASHACFYGHMLPRASFPQFNGHAARYLAMRRRMRYLAQ